MLQVYGGETEKDTNVLSYFKECHYFRQAHPQILFLDFLKIFRAEIFHLMDLVVAHEETFCLLI